MNFILPPLYEYFTPQARLNFIFNISWQNSAVNIIFYMFVNIFCAVSALFHAKLIQP